MSTHRYLMEGADGGYGISIVSSLSLKNQDLIKIYFLIKIAKSVYHLYYYIVIIFTLWTCIRLGYPGTPHLPASCTVLTYMYVLASTCLSNSNLFGEKKGYLYMHTFMYMYMTCTYILHTYYIHTYIYIHVPARHTTGTVNHLKESRSAQKITGTGKPLFSTNAPLCAHSLGSNARLQSSHGPRELVFPTTCRELVFPTTFR